ncbi:MAG: hypothetical protein ACJAZ0_000767, partial [Halioglobus sp.]
SSPAVREANYTQGVILGQVVFNNNFNLPTIASSHDQTLARKITRQPAQRNALVILRSILAA